MNLPERFHPAIRAWFERRFDAATEAQLRGWEAIGQGRDALVAAPTGSGKTLAAFLSSIDSLFRRGLAGDLPDGIDVVYVSPLKALSNDIQRNLEAPLAEIAEIARELGYDPPPIRAALRTGDTTQAARAAILRDPPHILITTPESLYLMLTAERARGLLTGVHTVIVDELHALMRDKRGSHLALSLARLDALCATAGDARPRPVRVALSATVHPIEEAARFLIGADRSDQLGAPACTIVNVGHTRDLDLRVEVPPSDLQAVATHEQWSDIYDRLAELIAEHRTTLVFVNTRRMAERVAHHLGERLGEEHVGAHHGSLSKDRRLRIEQRLKAGEMRAIVATASLELGIDVGSVDLVCQVGSPRSVTTFLQRVGRSGHALGLTSRGRLFATSRDELVECAAMIRAVRSGILDRVNPPVAPLDILAQQIVAECACATWTEEALYALVRSATPFAALPREDFDDVVEMLSEGPAPRVGRARGALIHRDRIEGTLRGRRAARITAITCGGAIPEVADYKVVLDPDETFVGTVDEDWAIESQAGDIFLLGSHSWRIRRIESARGVLRVEDAQGRPPSVPFWLGEAPGRTWELSQEVSRLRIDAAARLERGDDVVSWLHDEAALDRGAAAQLADYIAAERAALGVVPSQEDVVYERFFDDAGGMQMVVHAPFGGRVNRGFGLALRKRFCVNFDFELQAAATDDAVVLSLGPQHSFPLVDAFSFVRSDSLQETLEQALLTAPMFGARWRWNATRALAVLRQNGGKRVPPPLQRIRSDDLMAAVFPEQVGCQENITGPLQIPDHPLIRQTVRDCLYEAMDLERLTELVQKMERGEIRLHARDTVEPSPFAHEILSAKPYAFLDDAPLEERRTRAVSLRRTLPADQRDLGVLDAAAIERVRDEARPDPRDPDELHDILIGLVVAAAAMLDPEGAAFTVKGAASSAPTVGSDAPLADYDALASAGRAAMARADTDAFAFAAENLRLVEALYPQATIEPPLRMPAHLDTTPPEREDAVLATVRGHVEYLGPVTPAGLAAMLGLRALEVTSALARLEGEGIVLRGRFTPGCDDEEFCDRRLLARIHRYTLDRLRQEIEPVSAQDFMRFLLDWQRLTPERRYEGKRGLLEAVAQLQGFEVAAVAWERSVLPARVAGYNPAWLDEACLAGDVSWARLTLKKQNGVARAGTPSKATPITLALRRDMRWLLEAVRGAEQPEDPVLGGAAATLEALRQHGALFFEDLASASRQLPTQLENALWDLVARGLVSGDAFQSLRRIMAPSRSSGAAARRHQRYGAASFASPSASPFRDPRAGASRRNAPEGRWSIVQRFDAEPAPVDELAEAVAMQLLARYGVVFRDLVARENFAVPWREVVRALRRQEARGVVRGGRFVWGFIGEQYGLPQAVEGLRRVRRQDRSGEIVRINACDPLNLAGIITPGPRVPSVHTNAILLRDGLPVAVEEGKAMILRPEAGDISDVRELFAPAAAPAAVS